MTAPNVRGEDAEQDLDLIVADVEQAADGVVSLALRARGGGEVEALPAWSPGAHIDVQLGPDLVRQYSLCGDPAERDSWRIAVLNEPQGRGGSERIHQLRPGDTVRARGPRNHFRLERAATYVFIAGGIGITPILPMVAAAEAAGADWTLLYGGRTRDSMAFAKQLASHGARVALRPQDEHGLLDLAAVLSEPQSGTLVYCCGPEPLLAAVESGCSGWPAGSLHTERFSPKPLDPADTATRTAIEVECRASGITFTVPPGTSILHAAGEAGIAAMSSCQEGICGTCETAVIEGDPAHHDAVLSDEERAAGDVMMICCSWSRSARLVLDM